MTERIINAERVEQLIDVFGSFDANIKQIEAEFGVKVTNRDTELKIQGDVEQVGLCGAAPSRRCSRSRPRARRSTRRRCAISSTLVQDRKRG